ncbi:hypothetical protein H1164_08245 [Thermoactinomyces daqus]|uniref:Uncharacterized protein n=1 Tax=Thermoactinomyces daqus TaxID=1329516 RepID=A0A7W1XA26_9BACL|nr:minor capsid protein [Thermoactinomyces daqus]MBA4542890.1 hypothetical protein [Thermoactinomyces daqus]
MHVYELSSFLESNFDYTFFNNQFPSVQNPNIGMVRMFPTQTNSSSINRINAQCLIKNTDMQTAESKSWEIYESLRMKTGFQVGTAYVILCTASQPSFIQQMEDGCFLYSVDFQFITDQEE